jgi:hypothetical protein
LFGIAPIPLLVYLGTLAGNKREAALYQRHRDSGRWLWKTEGDEVQFDVAKKIRNGNDDTVALLVNVSGRNGIDRLPKAYASATVYELAPTRCAPSPTLISRQEDLANFRLAYRESIDNIRRDLSDPRELGLFPAVPIPLAIAMGLDLLPKADPALDIHDWRKSQFMPVLKVNT